MSEACPYQALLTELAGGVGGALQFVEGTDIPVFEGALSGAEVPLQAETDFLIQEGLFSCRDNSVGIQHIEVAVHGAQQVSDLQGENQATLQGGLFHAQIDQLVGAGFEVSHHDRAGVVAIQLHLPVLWQVEGEAGIGLAKEGVLVVNGWCALLPNDAVGGVKFQTTVVVGVGVESKGDVFTYRHFSQCHTTAKERGGAEIVVVHHLVARDGVEDGDDGKLVFGVDEVTHQGEIAAEASSERHIVAVAGFEVGVAHVRGIGIDIVFEGVELIVVGACNAAGVAEAKTFHHVGGVVARIECGEKVEIVLCDGVGGVIGVGVFAAQTCLDGPALQHWLNWRARVA